MEPVTLDETGNVIEAQPILRPVELGPLEQVRQVVTVTRNIDRQLSGIGQALDEMNVPKLAILALGAYGVYKMLNEPGRNADLDDQQEFDE